MNFDATIFQEAADVVLKTIADEKGMNFIPYGQPGPTPDNYIYCGVVARIAKDPEKILVQFIYAKAFTGKVEDGIPVVKDTENLAPVVEQKLAEEFARRDLGKVGLKVDVADSFVL